MLTSFTGVDDWEIAKVSKFSFFFLLKTEVFKRSHADNDATAEWLSPSEQIYPGVFESGNLSSGRFSTFNGRGMDFVSFQQINKMLR